MRHIQRVDERAMISEWMFTLKEFTNIAWISYVKFFLWVHILNIPTAAIIHQHLPPSITKYRTFYVHKVCHVTVCDSHTMSCNSMRMMKIDRIKSFIIWLEHVKGWYVYNDFLKVCWLLKLWKQRPYFASKCWHQPTTLQQL